MCIYTFAYIPMYVMFSYVCVYMHKLFMYIYMYSHYLIGNYNVSMLSSSLKFTFWNSFGRAPLPEVLLWFTLL